MIDLSSAAALSFDCYGTLIDWETGIATALRPWARRHGLSLTDEDLIAAHGRYETQVQQESPAMPYPAVLAETLRRVGSELGVEVGNDALDYGASVGDWPAFADSAAALRDLKSRFKLIILSNVDGASFAASNSKLGVEFDLIVTAEDVGSYKPDPANFHEMFARLATIGVERPRLIHAAESLYHDHEPAQQLGLPSVWINRRHDKPGHGATAPPRAQVTPQWQFTSMAEFAAAALG